MASRLGRPQLFDPLDLAREFEADLRTLRDNLHPGGIGFRAEAALGHMDEDRTRALLSEIADLLSPPVV